MSSDRAAGSLNKYFIDRAAGTSNKNLAIGIYYNCLATGVTRHGNWTVRMETERSHVHGNRGTKYLKICVAQPCRFFSGGTIF